MQVEVVSETGLVRNINEDSCLVCLKRGLFVVADGLGGHQAGETASKLAVEVLDNFLVLGDDPPVLLERAFQKANALIYSKACLDLALQGMGTTLTATWLVDGRIYLAHVGDSRAYLLRDRKMKLLTRDHSYTGELITSGRLTEEEARVHPKRHMLTRAIGTQSLLEVDLAEFPIKKHDWLLLCTDGLYGVVEAEEIQNYILTAASLRRAVQEMSTLALSRGGPDNITMVLVKYD
jgi:serine/threonine protein phosphatase PrpC